MSRTTRLRDAPTRQAPIWARGGGRAHARLTRVMALALGSASVVVIALQAPLIVEGFELYAAWWTLGVLGALACSTIALTAFFAVLSIPAILRWSAVHAVTILLGLGSLLFALRPGIEHPQTPWIVNVLVLGAAATAVAFRREYAWGYFAAIVVLLFVVPMVVTGTGIGEKPFQDALYNTFYLALCLSLALATHRAGRLIDAAAAQALADARTAATATARATADERMQSLVDDSVRVALLTFAGGMDDREAAEQSSRALAAIAREACGDLDAPAPVTLRELGWSLQAAVTELDPRTSFRLEQRGEAFVPVGVVDAMRDATAEALRNSLAHAGRGLDRPVARTVRVRSAPGRVDVDVIDDGRGFRLARIGEDKLGITVSIEDRMDQLPGGSSIIRTAPGSGTQVALAWRQS